MPCRRLHTAAAAYIVRIVADGFAESRNHISLCVHFKLKQLERENKNDKIPQSNWILILSTRRTNGRFIAEIAKSKQYKLVKHWPQCHSLNQLFTVNFFFAPINDYLHFRRSIFTFWWTIKNRFHFFVKIRIFQPLGHFVPFCFFLSLDCFWMHNISLGLNLLSLHHWNINYCKIFSDDGIPYGMRI